MRATKFIKLAIAIISCLFALTAWSEGTSLGDITSAAKRTGDKSREALVSIYGNVVNNPLASGGSGGGDTILANVFQVFNGALLVIGAMFAIYIFFRKTTQIAHDGTFYDRDKNTLWGPLRLVWGIAALVPTANGWALSQLLMLWAASLMGVGVANIGVDAAVSAFNDGKSMVVQPVMPSTVNLARNLFEANLCMQGINLGLTHAEANGALMVNGGKIGEFWSNSGLMLRNDSFVCGGADVNNNFEKQEKSTNLFGSTIDTSDIRKAHADALKAMQKSLNRVAGNFVNALTNKQNGTSVSLPDAEMEIQSAAQLYENTVNSMAAKKHGDIAKLASQLSTSIKEGGWWMLGAWYQTFAQANTKLSDAVAAKASTHGMSPHGDPAMLSIYQNAMVAYKTQQSASTHAPTLGTTRSGDYSKSSTGTDTNQIIGSFFNAPGQRLINYLINFDTGGDGRGQVNPLIKMKDLGDYTVGIVEAVIATYAAAKIVAKIPIPNFLQGAIDALSPFLIMAIVTLLLLGGTLSTYLPMVPFIIWFGAAVNWLVVVGEAIVAAPLWALTHLGGEGDGMGSRTAHGYIFILNVMMRPMLMVIGFLLGGAAVIAGGTLLNQLFGIALANAQFNSVTGLLSIIFYLAIYVSMCLNLVHSCFNLIFIVPDQVINWVGGQASATVGRDDNDRMRNAMSIFTGKLEQVRHGGMRGGGKSGAGKDGNGVKS